MTTTIPKPSATDKILAWMATENTGRHALDSGGAYGRRWERNLRSNPTRSPEPYLAAPKATYSAGEYVTISTFHYLRDRLIFLPRADRELERYGTTPTPGYRDDDYSSENKANWSWDETAVAFLNLVRVTDSRYNYTPNVDAGNTYNHDNNLDQDFVWYTVDVRMCDTHKKFHLAPSGKTIRSHQFKDPEPVPSWDGYIGDLTTKDLEPGTGPFPDCNWWDVTLVLISLHGGCDARGGYTQPRVFLLEDSDRPVPYGVDEFELWCNGADDAEPGDPDYVDPLQSTLDLALDNGAPLPERQEHQHALSHRSGGWTDWDGTSYRDPWDPTHNHPLTPSTPCTWSCTAGVTPTITPTVNPSYPPGDPQRFRDEPIPMWEDDSDPGALPMSPQGAYGPGTQHWINCPWCGRRMSVDVSSY